MSALPASQAAPQIAAPFLPLVVQLMVRLATPEEVAAGCGTCVACPIGTPAPDPAPDPIPGLRVSPLESAIWNALIKGPLTTKKLAAAVGQPLNPQFRTILRNFQFRKAIKYDKQAGTWRRAGG